MVMGKIRIPWAKPTIGIEELNEVIDTFESNWLTMGPKVRKFEQEMAQYLGVPHAIAVSNGTVALDLVLKAIGVGPDDEVIVPAMTYFATAAAISYQNAVPVFVDIEKDSFNLDAQRIDEAISEKTKAIIFIDYGGNPSDVDNIVEIGRKHGIPVMQDAAQSLGAVYKGVPMGAQTEISTMSFHMAKVMTCVEGGMIFTYDEKLRNEIICRRNQGELENGHYNHVVLGTNARLTDIQAGIALVQFQKLPELLRLRREVARKYDELFAKGNTNVKTARTVRENSQNCYFLYPILIDNRDQIALVLREEYGIDTRICYSRPVCKQEVYASKKLRCRHMECPVAEEVTSRILNLPIFPEMRDEMIEEVVDAVNSELNSVNKGAGKR